MRTGRAMIRDIHADSLKTSSFLSRYYMPRAITPLEVITVLNRSSVSFVLVGAHGLGGWMNKPRATEHVDVIVSAKHHKKAVSVLLEEVSSLEPEDLPVVTRFRNPESQKIVVDIIKPNQPIYRATFKHTKRVKMSDQEYRIPSLEMALAMKFAPMISPNRPQ